MKMIMNCFLFISSVSTGAKGMGDHEVKTVAAVPGMLSTDCDCTGLG
jgi:hypothetical protein